MIRFLILFLLIFSQHCFANPLLNLTYENGVSDRVTYNIQKDQNGFIWIATRHGIDKFDGEKIKNYSISFSRKYENEKIRGVIYDNQSHIYAYTTKNIHRYDEGKDCFYPIAPLSFIKEKRNTLALTTMHFDKTNYVWAGTTKGLFYSNDLVSWHEITELDSLAIYTIEEGINGDIWVGTSAGVKIIKKNNDNYYIKENPLPDKLSKYRIQSIFYDELTNMAWIGTFQNGLYRITHTDDENYSAEKILSIQIPIRSITKMNNTHIWIGTDGSGIIELNSLHGKLINNYSEKYSSNLQLASNSIYQILNDGDKVWLVGYASGIQLYNQRNLYNHIYEYIPGNNNSLCNKHINAICEDENGKIWFGSNCGISIFDPASGNWEHILQTPENSTLGMECSVILSLHESPDYIWAGGYSTNLIRINKNTLKSEYIQTPHKNTSENKTFIYSIEVDNKNDIWFGGNIERLTRYTPSANTFKQYPVTGISKIAQQNDSVLLISCTKGIIAFNKNTESFQQIDFISTSCKQSKQGYPFVKTFYADPDDQNILWIGTENDGVFKYSFKTDSAEQITMRNGLSSDYIHGIIRDRYGRIWISTLKGLNCLNPSSGLIDNYYTSDGIISEAFKNNGHCLLKSNRIIWSTGEGCMDMTLENLNMKYSARLNLIFTDFHVVYERVLTDNEKSFLSTPINNTKEIILPYNENSFSLSFLNVEPSQQRPVLYSWKLDGFNDDWSVPAVEHKAIYTNLPSGKYTFRVKVFSNNSSKDIAERSLVVIVKAPLWKTWPAYLIYLILLSVILYFALRYWRNRLEQINSEERIRFFINMAHDIRTPITLIKAPLNELDQEKLSEEGKQALSLARVNLEKLFNLVTQLLDFQKADNKSLKLIIEKTELNSFIENSTTPFSHLAKEKNIHFSYIRLPEAEEGWIDRSKLSAILQNLLSNAIKYTPAGGNVELSSVIRDGKLIITVTDDGIGIPDKAQGMLFGQFYRAPNAVNSKETGSGIGLMLTHKLTQIHLGKIFFSSKENIGSSFTVEIPVTKESYSKDVIYTVQQDSFDENSEQKKGTDSLLIVEDNDELRGYLSKYLSRSYHVIAVSGAKDALNEVKSNSFDLIISDIMMPDMDGLELCRILKNNIETSHIPVILLTSLAERADIIRGLKLGANDYITKPFDMDILESRIRSILHNKALLRKKFFDRTAFNDEDDSFCEKDKLFMKEVIDFIESNLENEEFTIDTLTTEMAMSRSVLYKKIKSLTGSNPKDLIKEMKMKKAAELLRENKYSIHEIAYLTGFPNAKYFSTAFKKYYGVTPTGFIESNG
ncbi:MAG: response regulator [Bacteroidales bacterium]